MSIIRDNVVNKFMSGQDHAEFKEVQSIRSRNIDSKDKSNTINALNKHPA